MSLLAVPLSILDLAPVGAGSDARQALQASVELAQEADELGYHRYWVAEHHNLPGVASSAPAVLLAHLAAVTTRMRVGSGGVMLPNHAPLVVAEQFGMLEALHPGRIDLGIGRAAGTDPETVRALHRSLGGWQEPDLPELLDELFGFFNGTFPLGHAFRHIAPLPARGYQPTVWLLGSSDYSARLAGQLGLPFSFAHHFAARNTLRALEIYRSSFCPSATLAAPHVMIGVAALCAEDHDRAAYLSRPGDLAFLRRRLGRREPLPTPEEAASFDPTPAEEELIADWSSSRLVGDADSVVAELAELVERTGADELMVLTSVHGLDDRARSYRLLAEAAGLATRVDRTGAPISPAG